MKVKIIEVVFNKPKDITPIGHIKRDKDGKPIICPKCRKGFLYFEWASGKTKCTQCDYVKN